ncbi:MAG: hypothetical protein R3C11_20350 [Planctomycetaceae bacterium]
MSVDNLTRSEKVNLALQISKTTRARFESRRPLEWRLSFAIWFAIGTVIFTLLKLDSNSYIFSDLETLKSILFIGAFAALVTHIIHLCFWVVPRNEQDQEMAYAMEMVALNLAKDHDSSERIHEVPSPEKAMEMYKLETGPNYIPIATQLFVTIVLVLMLIPVYGTIAHGKTDVATTTAQTE